MIILKYCSLISGRIISIEDEFIIIGNDFDVYSQTKLMYLDKTLIVDCEYNEISIDDLEESDYILCYHSNTMTMSIPPQTNAFTIERKTR